MWQEFKNITQPQKDIIGTMGWGLSPRRISQEHKENIFFWNAINCCYFSQILKAWAAVSEERYRKGKKAEPKQPDNIRQLLYICFRGFKIEIPLWQSKFQLKSSRQQGNKWNCRNHFNGAYSSGQMPPHWNHSEICPIFRNKGKISVGYSWRTVLEKSMSVSLWLRND